MLRKTLFLRDKAAAPRRLTSTTAALCLGLLAACGGGSTSGTDPNNSDMGGSGDGDGGTSNGDGGASPGTPITVTVSRSGSGMGKVTSQPAGIDCGGAGGCSGTFSAGSPLTLTAQGIGAAFSGWTGACAGQSAVCQFTPNGDVTVTASFDPLVCSADNICWEAPLPFGTELSDVFALAPNDVWAVGHAGTILHYEDPAQDPVGEPSSDRAAERLRAV
jgi:uncharacterized repeat protein (TIGR02543 family)